MHGLEKWLFLPLTNVDSLYVISWQNSGVTWNNIQSRVQMFQDFSDCVLIFNNTYELHGFLIP